MTEVGARHLRSYGLSGKSSIRRAASMVNPVHMLWLNFIALCCEARGLEALTESQILQGLNEGVRKIKDFKNRALMKIEPHRSELKSADGPSEKSSKRSKISVLPDVIAFEDDGLTWFEIDASRRGEDRLDKLIGLAKAIGTQLPLAAKIQSVPLELTQLKRVIILTTDEAYFRRVRNRFMAYVRTTRNEILTESASNAKFLCTGDGTFEIWRAGEGTDGQIDILMGHVIVQMLPTWLPNYKGNDPEKSQPQGWFSDNFLPYSRPKDMVIWRSPSSQFPLNLKK